jgi:peptidyl-prolyl cis-trans isomerase D
VSWAYNAKTSIGAVSSPLQAGNQYVIAVLKKITNDGVPSYENVRDIMEQEVYKEKKAEYYIKLLKDAKTLDETAQLAGERINQARGISLSSTAMPQAGNETYVIGKAFSLADGEMTMPVKGENGVYVIAYYGVRTAAIEKENYDDDKETVFRRHQGRTGSSLNGIYAGIKKRANVKDERSKF